MKKTFAVGDIHGCVDELLELLDLLIFKEKVLVPERDTVVFLGDYVDRGPDSRGVITELMNLQKNYPHWVFLYGNHEDLMLDALYYEGSPIYGSYDLWYQQGGRETKQSYIPKGLTDYDKALQQDDVIYKKHLKWLSKTDLFYETDDYFFIHGGVLPDVSLEELKGHLTRDDEMGILSRRAVLWARDTFINSDYDWGKKIIFGHTPNSSKYGGKFGDPIIKKNKIGLDGAVCPPASRNLLAVELPSEKIYKVSSKANLKNI